MTVVERLSLPPLSDSYPHPTPILPPATLVLRSLSQRKIPNWKIHLLELVKQVPVPIPVYCRDSEVLRLSMRASMASKDSSSASSDLAITAEGANRSTIIIGDQKTDPGQQPRFSINIAVPTDLESDDSMLRTQQEIMESRIKSLRLGLEIGDLSIAENLEKLCDHYFKLDKDRKKSGDEQVPTTKDLNKTELTETRDEVSNSDQEPKLGEMDKNDPTLAPKTDPERPEDPKPRSRLNQIKSRLSGRFDKIFHGLLSKSEAQKLLQNEGEFLVRQIIQEDGLILSFRFNSTIHNFRIIEALEGLFCLEDRKNCYGSLKEMVAEGLRSMFLDHKAGDCVDIMTEIAQINKHDSMISWLSPSTSNNSNSPNSRKNSATPLGFTRQVSMFPAQFQQFGQLANSQVEELVQEQELTEHWFLPGLPIDKKTLVHCEIPNCLLKQKGCTSKSIGKATLQCRDCGLTIHEKCLDQVTSQCEPELVKIPEIFGTDLTTLVKAKTNTKPTSPKKLRPPFVIVKCVEELEKRGLTSEGIYRVSGSQDVILKIQESFEKDRESACLEQYSDLDSICGVLKLYLRTLPEPLITREVFGHFVTQAENDPIPLSLTVDRVKKGLKEVPLPIGHKISLKYLLNHLHRVAEERQSNMMSSYNLSSVLAPSIIVPEEMSLNTLKLGTDLVDILIKNVEEVFSK